MRRRRVMSQAACALALTFAASSYADPQWNAGVVLGAAGLGRRSDSWQTTDFYGAARGDLLFGRSGPRDFGIGPSLELGSANFSDFRLLLGPTLLVPVGDLFAFEATPSGFVHDAASNARLGVSGRLFFGLRGYNYDARYAMSAGLVLGFDQDLNRDKDHAAIVAAEVDALVLALPFILLYEWIRGPSN